MIKEKRFGWSKLLNVIIIIACLIFLMVTVSFGEELTSYFRKNRMDESSLLSYVQSQQYPYLTEYVYRDEIAGESISGDREKIYAVVHYYENAVMYQAYMETGDTMRAKERYAKMQEYQAEMGEFAFAETEIQEMLGITQK